MLRNYFKLAFRNLRKNKVHSLINIAGLSVGMSVAMLIGLWMYDEMSFDKYHENYNGIAQVMQSQTFNGTVRTGKAAPLPLGAELAKSYGDNFKYIVMASWGWNHILTAGDKKFSKQGNYMDVDGPEMLSLNMIEGTRGGLKDPSSILLSQSVAKALFGNIDPMGKIVKMDNHASVKVTGVYEDLPYNTTFRDLSFIASWALYTSSEDWIKSSVNDWTNNAFQTFVQIAPNADMAAVSAKIKNAKLDKLNNGRGKRINPQLFLQPMNKWHLYSDFKNGVNTGGRIQYVWLFGIIGIFVLLLACINFMNLSTARSEKRAREVGIRKAVGSVRSQLIYQFYCESLMIAFFAFMFSLLLVQITLPFFNQVADKKMDIPWQAPLFWAMGMGFTFITGIIAGSYPALYLSSFNPVKVLKGTFRSGRFAATPRKVLVVLQFTVSVMLIIGTVIVFREIEFAKNRPVGYTRDGLVTIEMATNDLHKNYDAVYNDMIKTGAVTSVAESSSPATEVQSNSGGFEWQGKDPNMTDDFATMGVSHDYGKTVGWQFVAGRDFSKQFLTDSSALVINETAAKYMGLKNPVGQTVKWDGNYKIIGVIKDVVMASPYEPVKQAVYYIDKDASGYFTARINPAVSAKDALNKIEAVYKTYSPATPFTYKFVDDEYAKKFSDEERIGKLASVFAMLAIFISCLGLFGMASFMAEQRTKEIGVRKVLGASVFNLWRLLSKDFVVLIIISCLIAVPLANYFMGQWLLKYEYRTPLTWWIYAVAVSGALFITLCTVSYQGIKAALTNPVKSLKTE